MNDQNTPVKTGKGFSVSALVLGLLGVIGGWFPVVNYFTGICALLGLIFGVVGRKKSLATTGRPSGLATAGLVLGIIGTAFAAIGIICTLACAGAIAGAVGSL